MEIVLVRHGQPEWVRGGLNVDDPPLTRVGQDQAVRMAEALARERFDEVVCSPLVRARQTAAPLLERLGRDERVEDWTEEIRNPVWHGTPAEKAEVAFAELRARPAAARWEGLDGGESPRDFVQRVHNAASYWLAERGIERIDGELPLWRIREPDRRLAIVAHAGTNTVLIGHLLGLVPTPWEWERFVLHHASISRVEAVQLGDGWTFCLTRLSGVDHLPAELRTR
jgi:probable phosphoglycerate mutase